MHYKVIVMLHILGACVWVGGHIVLMGVILPKAMRAGDPQPVLDFGRGYGRLGLGALIGQLLTGLWLTQRWIGDWSTIFSEPTPQGHLVLSKLMVLMITLGLAGFAYHNILPRVEERGLRSFALLSGAVTMLTVVMLILGVAIRTGGLR